MLMLQFWVFDVAILVDRKVYCLFNRLSFEWIFSQDSQGYRDRTITVKLIVPPLLMCVILPLVAKEKIFNDIEQRR